MVIQFNGCVNNFIKLGEIRNYTKFKVNFIYFIVKQQKPTNYFYKIFIINHEKDH